MARKAASSTPTGVPANVSTVRLWSRSEERSSSFTSLTDWMAAAIWSITSGRRASEKLGIHSINVVMWSRSLIVWWSGGRVAPNGIRGRTETRLVKAIITTVR